tara:strand:- start:3229 stop:3795 length:567 start_codon:yes stop_codon:yes gene_type:complete
VNTLLLSSFIALISFSSFANASVWGGTLYSKNQAVRLSCLSGSQDECDEFAVERASVSNSQIIGSFRQVTTITAPENNVWASASSRESQRGINAGYGALSVAGTFVGLTSCMFVWYSCPYDLVAGIIVDVYKAPVVAAAYITHTALQIPRKKKLARNISFLLNPESANQIKKTSKAQVKFIIRGVQRN